MFNYVIDNRKLSPETGGGGGDIIISGMTDKPTTTPIKTDTLPPSNPNPTPTPSSTSEEYVPVDDNNHLLLEAISDKFTDTSVVKLNKNGDLVNLEGTVLITKADLDTKVGTVKTSHVEKASTYIKTLNTVEIDGKEHTISEDGSVVGSDGVVLLSAQDLIDKVLESGDYLNSDEDNDDVFAQVQALTGLELVDDKGEAVEFEFTPEGLAKRDLHIARQEGSRIANELIGNFFNDNPQIEDAFYYLKTKGTLDGFGNQTDHEGITLDANNEQQLFDTVVEAEMVRGYTKEQAIKRANIFKNSDVLFEEAKDGLAFIVNKERADKEAQRIEYERQQTKLREEQTQYWNDVLTKVSTGKVLDYTIPENIRVVKNDGTVKYYNRSDFYNYMSRPVKNGLTQAQMDAQSEPLDVKIFNDYLRFVGHNMSYIVDQKVKQTKVTDLKQRFNREPLSTKKLVVNATQRKSKNDNIVI
jgi:hypothetical protein